MPARTTVSGVAELRALGPANVSVRVSLKPGGSWLWWAKYPAPPAGVKKINYYTAHTAPFEDIPISDQ